MVKSFMRAVRAWQKARAGVPARFLYRSRAGGTRRQRGSKPRHDTGNRPGSPGSDRIAARRRIPECRQLAVQRDLPRRRRYRCCRNHPAVAQRA